MKKFWLLLPVCLFIFSSCNEWDQLRVFEKNVEIPHYAWKDSFNPSYTVNITDTNSRYNIYVTLRHTDAYRFSNIWLQITTQYPFQKPITERVELPLADQSGKWLGSGMDGIYSHRILIQQNALFNKIGTYFFSFHQDMRENPLRGVMDVGLRVEKSGERRP
ncbi:MAG: gliding motility lipoprotein GldH [Chitinophagaceae bacterium]